MLASTVQFSNTNQKHTANQNHPSPHHNSQGRFDSHDVSDHQDHHTNRCVASGPNSVPTHSPPPTLDAHGPRTTTEAEGSTGDNTGRR
ncbi:hypothetical protein Acsp05_74390 [Actinokineospora sp. NBRC 105648]|nr:hypothetical protein Acsp05_74390 [Actinokineospora sp. NBRC 105648]